jgi:hypothetical protein
MNLMKRIKERKEAKEINTNDRVREDPLEDAEEEKHFSDEYTLSDNRLGDSEIVMKRLDRDRIKKGFEIS